MVTGILGACLGTILSRFYRKKVPHVDPLICAVGLLTSASLFIICIFVVMTNIPATYVRDKPLSSLSTKAKATFLLLALGIFVLVCQSTFLLCLRYLHGLP